MDLMLRESMASIRGGDVEGGKRNLQISERALDAVEKLSGPAGEARLLPSL